MDKTITLVLDETTTKQLFELQKYHQRDTLSFMGQVKLEADQKPFAAAFVRDNIKQQHKAISERLKQKENKANHDAFLFLVAKGVAPAEAYGKIYGSADSKAVTISQIPAK